MKAYYKYSDAGKPPRFGGNFVNKRDCLRYFIGAFRGADIVVIADSSARQTAQAIREMYELEVHETELGNCGANVYMYEQALKLQDDEIVFFAEDDYLWLPYGAEYVEEGLSYADYVSLYDHPDKYGYNSPNPYVKDGGEDTRVFVSKHSHWKHTNSTTMTFGTRVWTLRKDIEVLKKHNQGSGLPEDFNMWCELGEEGSTLATPLPSRATHLDGINNAPLIDWIEVLYGNHSNK